MTLRAVTSAAAPVTNRPDAATAPGPGAGRPETKGRRVSEPHLRAVRGLRLRKSRVYDAIREALAQAKLIRICHVSIQQSHMHLIVEAAHAHNLSRGLQSAKKINAALGTTGTVFADRYLDSTIDPFSSAAPLPVDEPATWLLRVGWKRHGPISVYAIPGGNHAE